MRGACAIEEFRRDSDRLDVDDISIDRHRRAAHGARIEKAR